MKKKLTFIHAADLHLGAPFRGFQALSETWAKKLVAAIPESYEKVIDAAIDGRVDFVVFAGDIFDTAKASYADYHCFFKGLDRLNEAGIAVYLCTGNHDPYTSWQQDFFAFPPNTSMISADRPGFQVFEKEGEALALIAGRGFYNQAWPNDEDIAEGITREAAIQATGVNPPFTVGVLHTGLNFDPEKAPTDPEKLLQADMDYWALGHIHIRHLYPKDNPKLAFSGCIQGRDINETGDRGILKVTLTEGQANEIIFIPTASIVWQKMKVDISDLTSLGAVVDRIVRDMFQTNSKTHCEEMCVRITLIGKTNLHTLLASPGVLQDMRKSINDAYPMFFCDALIDRTVLPFEKETLMKEGLFPATFMQVAHALREDREEQIDYLQHEFLAKGFHLPRWCERHVEELSEEAEELILDMLTGSDES